MELPCSDSLNTAGLAAVFDSTAESYKFFWFGAILERIIKGEETVRFSSLVNDMIAAAWYMVSEYHLSLGPADTMEKLILELQGISLLKSSDPVNVITDYLENCGSALLKKRKLTLINEVPYRLQSTMVSLTAKEWQKGSRERIRLINAHEGLIYTFSEFRGLDTEVRFDAKWASYIRKNAPFLKGWYRYRLIDYLQRRNPDVPGIPMKLSPPQQRKLSDVASFWRTVMEIHPVRDIYSGEVLSGDDISIDHFIPWSYTASDEFWNLDPTSKSINSSKGNFLPEWDTYFPALCALEYGVYSIIHSKPQVRDCFEKAAGNHFSSLSLKAKLFGNRNLSRETFSRILSEEAAMPLYNAAERCGFLRWKYEKKRLNHNFCGI